LIVTHTATVCTNVIPQSLKEPESAKRIDVGGIFGNIKRYFHVALCAKVINFVRIYFFEDVAE
jgi:hypothetical protein